jgi:hypothetical protein
MRGAVALQVSVLGRWVILLVSDTYGRGVVRRCLFYLIGRLCT